MIRKIASKAQRLLQNPILMIGMVAITVMMLPLNTLLLNDVLMIGLIGAHIHDNTGFLVK